MSQIKFREGVVASFSVRKSSTDHRSQPRREPNGGYRTMLHAKVGGNYAVDAKYTTVTVNVTNYCNLNCRHCFVFRDGNPNVTPRSITDEMSDAVMLDTIAQLRDRHAIEAALWMGGEPLLKPALLREAVALFEKNTITTNGTAPLIDFGPDVLYVVSLDGPEDLNDAIRGAGTFRKVFRNLHRLPDDFESKVQVQCVVTKANQHRLEELVREVLPTRVGWMTFSFLVPAGASEHNPDAWASNGERVEAVRIVQDLKDEYPGFIRNSRRSLELLIPPYADRVTSHCPAMLTILPLYLEGDHFTTPFCCYGNDVDCQRCGAWVVFHQAAEMEKAGVVSWDGDLSPGRLRDDLDDRTGR